MKYTVVIPAYNAAKTISETIESALRQTLLPCEILVIDDGSTDSTSKIAAGFGEVRVLVQANAGPGSAMSLGMRSVQTPWIASIDADDVWLPEKMERQAAFMTEHLDCDGVFANLELFGEGVSEPIVQDGWSRTTMVIRREVFDVVGDVVDPPGMRGEMIDWISRIREAGFRLALMPDVLARRRVSSGSLSNQRNAEKDRGYVHVARAALLRKRARLQKTEG